MLARPARAADPLDRRLHRPGLLGHVTLELSNVATLPIKLWPGMKIGQLCLFRLPVAGRAPVRVRRVRLALPGPARARRRAGPTNFHRTDV